MKFFYFTIGLIAGLCVNIMGFSWSFRNGFESALKQIKNGVEKRKGQENAK